MKLKMVHCGNCKHWNTKKGPQYYGACDQLLAVLDFETHPLDSAVAEVLSTAGFSCNQGEEDKESWNNVDPRDTAAVALANVFSKLNSSKTKETGLVRD